METIAVADAAGRVLREPATSQVDLPPFASSAMDGFAVRADEVPAELPVAFRVAAGTPAQAALLVGTAAAIATGGAVPAGADAIVPVEHLVDHGDRVEIPEDARPGQHIRPRGGDVREGDIVAAPGTLLGPAQIGALAAVGIAEVRCSVRPRVAVLATGSELRAAGDALAPGQIYESNRPMIAAVLRAAGAEVELLPVVEDDEDAHREALERGLEADVLVTSGGVSMGPHDLVRKVVAELGVEEVFWGVSVKPGKPLSFGVRGATLVFGLPGNPVSSLVGSLLFVRPALLARQGVMPLDLGFEHGRDRGGAPTEPPPRRVRAGAPPLGGGRCLRRTGLWPGVAHDRSSRRRRRSDPRSSGRGRDCRRYRGSVPQARLARSTLRSDRRTTPAGGGSRPAAYGP